MSQSPMMRAIGASALLASRVRDRVRREPRVAYVGAARSLNVGDRAMVDVVRSLIPSVRWIPAEAAVWERRLSRVGLSGRRYFSLAVLGGGTMMNANSEAIVETLLDAGVRFVSLGTGAGSGGWDLPPGFDLSRWTGLLRRFEWVTVRGPRTQHALQEVRFSAASAIGDLALAYTKANPAPAAGRRRRLVYNVIEQGPRETWNPSVMEALGRTVSRRANEGWEIVALAMYPSDRAVCESLASRHGFALTDIIEPRTGWELVDALEAATLVVSMRLHGVVFATAAATPVVSLGYRAKCDDFMESVGAESALLPIDVSGATPAIVDLLNTRIGWAVEHASEVHRRALAHAHEIRRRADSIAVLAAQEQR